MTYLWEVLLRADEQLFPREKLYFRQAETPSPYMEVAFEELNRKLVDETPVEVNAYYRFSAIFDYLLSGNLDELPEFKAALYDILMHYAAEINMREGLCKSEYFGSFLKEDVRANKFGESYAEVFKTFPRQQVRFVIESMVRLYEIGPSITLLKNVLRQVYRFSILYLHAVERRELLVYIGKRETAELSKQVDFLLSMFVPFDYIVHLFWDCHFGIIGVDETLLLDDFMIY